MFENILKFFKRKNKKENTNTSNSKDTAKERLHLVLMQDRANVSADFLELMKQEIIEVIKKYIDVDESAIDVRLTNKENSDGTNGAPALYANIPILNIKNEARKVEKKKETEKQEDIKQEEKVENSKESEDKKEAAEEEKEREIEEKVEEAENIIEEAKTEEKKEENEEKAKNDDKQKDEEAKEKIKSENKE